MRIITEGYVYRSRQNGLVLNPRGISPTISVGQHSGVEPMIRTIYESDKLREPWSEQRRLERGRTPADAGDELRQVFQRRDELAEGLYDSNGL